MFATHLKDFCSDTGMVISDEAMLAGNTFTQLSEIWHSTSWLDHCLSTSDGHNLITAMHVQYGTSCRDHIPLIVDISIESVPVLEYTVNDTTSMVDWDKLSGKSSGLGGIYSEHLLHCNMIYNYAGYVL